MQRTIENLRERPRHERQAVAFWISTAVVSVLFVVWGIFFLRSLTVPDLQPVNDAYNQAVQQIGSAPATASAAVSQAPQPPDDTGWVSSALPPSSPSNTSQPVNSAAADGVQLIQDSGSNDASMPTDSSSSN